MLNYFRISQCFLFCRVLDIELESEDEDAVIERRRQMRKAIEQKYQSSPQPQVCMCML